MKKSIQVRFRDCDMMGHVNNAVYLTYFEEARSAYWKELMGDEFKGFDFILAELTCTYKRPAEMDEMLDIDVRVSRIGNSSFDFEYRITCAGEEVATGRSVQVMYDYFAQAKTTLTPELRQRIEKFQA